MSSAALSDTEVKLDRREMYANQLPPKPKWTAAKLAGNDGYVRHVKSSFRRPAFEGDVTFFDAEGGDTQAESAWGVPLAQVKVRRANQDGGVIVDATAEVERPVG